MNNKRIVITGIGIASPIGIGREAFVEGLKNGKSGIKKIKVFNVKDQELKVGGEIRKFDPKAIIGDKGLVDMDRATALLLCAGKMALDDSKLGGENIDRSPIGVSMGTTYGSLKSILDFDRDSIVDGPRFVNASKFPNTVMNSPAGRLAIRCGLKAVNSTISTGFCASIDAIEYAVNAINNGRADIMLAGGTEELCIETYLGFKKIKYTVSPKNEEKTVMRPFDKKRAGTILGEGSAVLVIEDLESAIKRNAPIYAEIKSIKSLYYPYEMFQYDPSGSGMMKAMAGALDGLDKNETIDCVFANANSTLNGDEIEAKAIREIFDHRTNSGIPVTAIKSYTGETFSAAGAINVASAVLCIKEGIILKIAGFSKESKGQEQGLNYVKKCGLQASIKNALVNVFSPNGFYSSCVIRKYE